MTRIELAYLVGSAAGTITVLSFVPQAIRVWRTKRTQDLSFGTSVLLVVQSAGWTIYGVLVEQPPLIWTNSLVLAFTLFILAAKVRHG
jgi:MtN3 and saliva related transmembrane protein